MGKKEGALKRDGEVGQETGSGGRPANSDQRPREYLTPQESEALVKAAGQVGRYPHRDSTLVLVMWSHGLRVSEAVNLRRSQIDLEAGLLHVTKRSKNGRPSTHPLRGREIRSIRRLLRESRESPFLFVTERGTSLERSVVYRIVRRAGEKAGFDWPVHPHMLRHATGYLLVNQGRNTREIQHYLGHRNIRHSAIYTELDPNRFDDLWND